MRPRYFRQRQQNTQLLLRARMFRSLIPVQPKGPGNEVVRVNIDN